MAFNGKGLKDIVSIYGPAGNETLVAEYIVDQIKDL